jgi:hypothetical protein
METHHDSPGEGWHQSRNSWSPYARLPQRLRSQLRQSWKYLGFNNETAHWFRRYFACDFETMQQILKEAGFAEIRLMKPDTTDVEVFKGLDREDPWRMAMTSYVEAMRP